MAGRIHLVALFPLLLAPGLPAADPPVRDPFAGAIWRLEDARTGRVSSWDRTGDNRDFISFRPGETKELLSLDGPGALTHLDML